ncbi:MAG: hypothetical protein ACHQF0_15030 [Chitinophagales bacterium]
MDSTSLYGRLRAITHKHPADNCPDRTVGIPNGASTYVVQKAGSRYFRILK